MMSELNFFSSNANGFRLSKKQIKAFQHLKQKILQWYYFFYKKHTPLRILSLNGRMTLQDKYFFHTD